MPSPCATPSEGYSSLPWGLGLSTPQGIPTPPLPQGAALVVRGDSFFKSCVFSQRGNNMEILCKAATVAQEGQSCHKYLEGIYYNLLSLVWGSRARHKKPCPAASGSTISLKDFLKELHQVLQEEFKSQK
uniref:Interleukin-4 n=1 Tax=Ficedula albicollis TaxID=59894 RepID=U3KIA0_FICAL